MFNYKVFNTKEKIDWKENEEYRDFGKERKKIAVVPLPRFINEDTYKQLTIQYNTALFLNPDCNKVELNDWLIYRNKTFYNGTEIELKQILTDIIKKGFNIKSIYRLPYRFVCNYELVMKNNTCSFTDATNIFRKYIQTVIKQEQNIMLNRLDKTFEICKLNGNVLTKNILEAGLEKVNISRKTRYKYISKIKELDSQITIISQKEKNFLTFLELNKTFLLENIVSKRSLLEKLNSFNKDYSYSYNTMINYINKHTEINKYFEKTGKNKPIKEKQEQQIEQEINNFEDNDFDELFNDYEIFKEKEDYTELDNYIDSFYKK